MKTILNQICKHFLSKSILIVLGLSLPITGSCQSWQAEFDNIYYHYGGGLIKSEDNGYYWVGACDDSNNVIFSKSFVVKFDSFFNTIWKKNFGVGFDSPEGASDILLQPDNTLIISGDFTNNQSLVKTANDGTYITRKKLSRFASNADMFNVADGNIIVVSSAIYKLDQSLNIVWSKFINYDTLSVNFKCADTLSNGDIICGGTAFSGWFGMSAYSKITQNGTIVWNKFIQHSPFSCIQDLKVLNDNSFIAISCNNNQMDNCFFISRFDSNGGLVWEKKIYAQDSFLLSVRKIERRTSDFIIGGTLFENTSTRNDIFIVSIDSNININWATRHGNSTNESLSGMTLDYDNNPILSGTRGNFLAPYLGILFKLDSAGLSYCNSDSIILVSTNHSQPIFTGGISGSASVLAGGPLPFTDNDLQIYVRCSDIPLYTYEEKFSNSSNFVVYPNPSDGKFFIENKVGIKSDLEIKIYNSIGELLFSTPFNETQTELDIAIFSGGIYFITVNDDGSVLWKTKLVKE